MAVLCVKNSYMCRYGLCRNGRQLHGANSESFSIHHKENQGAIGQDRLRHSDRRYKLCNGIFKYGMSNSLSGMYYLTSSIIKINQWDIYFDQLEPIATSVSYMAGIGNHERNYPNTMY